ncbi:MAG: hypothetical protein OEZ01_17980 [Candidatus Heimdallarchaeota archaeon]|nr:hypothetical protein [Candidatus Heimdallarchaeota archaeon]MDH5647904.1 hypothetical protein [Candidatus Heimdallarchaeota archaeon]
MSVNEILLNIWKREKSNQELIEIDEDFFEKCKAYLHHLEIQSQTETDVIIKSLFSHRWKRVNFIVNDLINLRLIKQSNIAVHQKNQLIKTTVNEQKIKDSIIKLVSEFRNDILGVDLVEYEDFQEIDEGAFEYVEFIQSEIESVGIDLRNYGPFDVGDIVLMPKINSNSFFKRSKIDLIRIDR